jgi:hypothetical protein
MKAEEERRRCRLSLRVSSPERSCVDAAAERAGLCLSDYLRRIVLGAPPLRAKRRPPLEIRLAAQLLMQLGAIASHLHAILRSSGTPLTIPTERDLVRALSQLRECRLGLLKMLGRRPARP